MLESSRIRRQFLDFFEKKGHQIVDSAPIVLKNDPTLMFTNAGMNQFKDYFLSTKRPKNKRVANTQKCLRVSGKHNDLEEVGIDTYHHTMFEMLCNWSFGEYFKDEAIAWAWELLTEVYGLDKDRLYVTYFGGEKKLQSDEESKNLWKKHIQEDRILPFGKKDNFWEMGDVGPTGPCSEIHIDLRNKEERDKIDGRELVNKDHDQVIEIWNLVFIQYNKKADGSLEILPEKHVDTGMGLERLVRAIYTQKSNYDSNIFQDIIREIEDQTGFIYGKDGKTDTAMRVLADHTRAVAFCVADGQLPSNNKAGYVVRRILRRGLRYGFSFLDIKKPFMYVLVEVLAKQFKDVFANLHAQKEFVQKVMKQEEETFIQTLSNGLDMLENIFEHQKEKKIDGQTAFLLNDTYGFPIDLTQLISKEYGFDVDIQGFQKALQEQKNRSKQDANTAVRDWEILVHNSPTKFIGYDFFEAKIQITRFREIKNKKKSFVQAVFSQTPFYPEGGGQVGDIGFIQGVDDGQKIGVLETKKENDLIVHLLEKTPKNCQQNFLAKINTYTRISSAKNHSATHLLQAALKNVLGSHIEQKGSLVNHEYLRFDFAHFEKVSKDELLEVEQMVNDKIRQAIPLEEQRAIPLKNAIDQGATALFGEKYGDTVRMITFDKTFSKELCGGTHVANTSKIENFKIISESAVASGIRRIEAITGEAYHKYVNENLQILETIRKSIGKSNDVIKSVQSLIEENKYLQKEKDKSEKRLLSFIKADIKSQLKQDKKFTWAALQVEVGNAQALKDLSFQLKKEYENIVLVLAAEVEAKVAISVLMSENLVSEHFTAKGMIKSMSSFIQGGGGGQDFFATAGGKNPDGIKKALEEAKKQIQRG
ncbi:MAG: alanine--tRNA ligase [Bacteroidota bacterium]|nr:alanine--tRNA ligase [Bacteroidota bacterium]